MPKFRVKRNEALKDGNLLEADTDISKSECYVNESLVSGLIEIFRQGPHSHCNGSFIDPLQKVQCNSLPFTDTQVIRCKSCSANE